MTGPDRRRLVRGALLVRRVEERLLELYARGEVPGTVHTAIGQEFSAVAVADHLVASDKVLSNHRCHGHYLAVTGDVPGLVGEVLGRANGVNQGRGGSQHLHTDRFVSTGVQGGCVPIAAGLAMANRDDGIAVCFIGDGTLGEGVVYEVFNLASLWRLPVLFVVEANGYAQSTRTEDALAGTIAGRAEAFGIRHGQADTWHWEELWATARDAVRAVRSGAGPFVLEVRTARLGAHSKGDDDRDPAEIARLRSRDPLTTLIDADDPDVLAVRDEVERVVDNATAAALAAGPGTVPVPAEPRRDITWSKADAPRARFVDGLRSALADLMRSRPDAYLIGEDVRAPYGGAFKVTGGLSTLHPDRVRNTPISEAAIVGVATGLALGGALSLVEVMFGDFVTLAADQLVNQAAKLGFLAGQGPDVVLRTPMGGGRGYGPTHSQSLERMFLGVPGLRVLAHNGLAAPELVVGEVARGGTGPTLLVENKQLYGRVPAESLPAGFTLLRSDERFPTMWLRPARPATVTLLGHGGICHELVLACERLFTEHDVIAQVISPTQLYPLDFAGLREAVGSAPVLVIAEEGQGFAGFGAEVGARVAERGLPTVVRRVAAAPHGIPAGRVAEQHALPGVDDVVDAALDGIKAVSTDAR
ncbi:dehydrogenase E1 component subunit alpha/beta [Kutzneria kofuensis]|uniref:dihydrolipoyllysine-residue succinyltransferase n=1 Tax=Kutzneria kofuensis TaxID=103725 RepID=A0A7W9KQX3_9PSEU|nr:alpha-ketoacid dehydrogenase subunit alpha/beta [Kutzneria kofuensis]MBB5896359.1 2-oxoisovalerate dehydrogenase E1 component [Kutzneria kofuensis]